MHVYLRWYQNGQPQSQPQRMESESAARAAIQQQYPAATFGPKVSTLHQPTAFNLVGIDEVLYAYPGPQAAGLNPIADILFPVP